MAREKTERRRYPRLKKDLLIGLRGAESLAEYKASVTENVSLGGIKMDLQSLEGLSVNQPVEVVIKDAKGKDDPIKALGRIAWMQSKEKPVRHEVGIHITYVQKKDQQRFLEYLNPAGTREQQDE